MSFRLRLWVFVEMAAWGDMAIDDVSIYTPAPIDVQANKVIAPGGGCDLGASEAVTVEIVNVGTDPLTNVIASFFVDGGAPIAPENVPTTIQAGDTIQYTFNATADLSAFGTHSITIITTQTSPADTVNDNDTVSISLANFPEISTFPYSEDFESGMGGWVSGGINSTWAFGTPAKTVIIGAASGDSAWVTGGLGTTTYVNNENSFVISPCFNFSTLSNPLITLDIWWDAENSFDGAVLQSSVDAGVSWQNVGEEDDPVNWFNDGTISGNPGGQQIGWTGTGATGSGGWVRAEHGLAHLANEPNVIFRIAFGSDISVVDDGFAFDNINIRDKPPN